MIRIEGLSKAYGPKVLLSRASYHFPQGQRVALVGANGVGKTTLLNIICGTEECDAGEIIKPGRMVIGYLPQIPNQSPSPTVLGECCSGATTVRDLQIKRDTALATMSHEYSDEAHHRFEAAEEAFAHAGGYLVESRAREILSGLGFRNSEFERSPLELSGGWRMRLELAKLFLNNPDMLILDEPTNHLDLPSLVWVEKFLLAFRGTVLFVSHDHDLLNRLAGIVLHLIGGTLTSYKGNFDSFLEQREVRALEEAAFAEQLRRRRQTLERFVERFGAKASKAAQAQSKLKMLSRIQELESDLAITEAEPTLNITLPDPVQSGREVLSIDGASIGYSTDLATNLNLKISRGSKVAIIGVNGIGKSTLLKSIAGVIPWRKERATLGHNVELAYFAQEQLDVLNPNESVLRNVMGATNALTEREARSLLGSFLFRGDEVFKPVRVLSGGEKSRVGLARLLACRANFLLLDEPTNHLDMSSVEALANALDEYPGTVLFVSHDRRFIDNVCTHLFVMLPDGRSALFTGKLDDYERLAAQSGFPNVLSANLSDELTGCEDSDRTDREEPPMSHAQASERASFCKRERQRLEKQLRAAESLMETTSANLAELEQEMLACDMLDYQKVREIQTRQKGLHRQLIETEEQWLDLSTALESIQEELRALGRG